MTDAQRDARIEWHTQQTLKHFAAKRPELARFHCRIFTRLARKRAANFLNDGTGAPGLLNFAQQARRHPSTGGMQGE